jgi:hypothetical protein
MGIAGAFSGCRKNEYRKICMCAVNKLFQMDNTIPNMFLFEARVTSVIGAMNHGVASRFIFTHFWIQEAEGVALPASLRSNLMAKV